MNKYPLGWYFFCSSRHVPNLLPVSIKPICKCTISSGTYLSLAAAAAVAINPAVLRYFWKMESKNNSHWIDLWKFGMQKQSNEFSIKCGKSIINSLHIKIQNVFSWICLPFVSLLWLLAHCRCIWWRRHCCCWWWCSKSRKIDQSKVLARCKFVVFFLLFLACHLIELIILFINIYLTFTCPNSGFMIKMHELCASHGGHGHCCCCFGCPRHKRQTSFRLDFSDEYKHLRDPKCKAYPNRAVAVYKE